MFQADAGAVKSIPHLHCGKCPNLHLVHLLLNKLEPNNPNASPINSPILTFLIKIPMTSAKTITKPNEINPLVRSGLLSDIKILFSCSAQ